MSSPADPTNERDESPIETLDRNWSELLQELRVVQTGVQLLTGFLLTLPFQSRFEKLSSEQRDLYLVVVLLAAASTTALIAPVTLHRILFREHVRRIVVGVAHWCALVGSALLGLALVGVNLLIFDVVLDRRSAVSASSASLAAVAALWFVLPLCLRLRASREVRA